MKWYIPGEPTRPQALYKPSGGIIVDGVHVADTIQCAHCGKHWIPVKGSGKIRGFCTKCNAKHCGEPVCWECKPYKKRLYK